MDDRFRAHVEQLVADAEREAAREDWKAARALADAALALQADDPRARAVLRSAQNAMSRVGERRQLTVMFSDVVGSTQLTSQVDPEIVREILRSYQSVCADVVARYDGYVATYLGDGVVAYFGYPQIHEDDPVRAVHAGLDLLESLGELTTSVRRRFDLPFAVRVAVHTGLVVRAEMGGPGRRDVDAVVGATPNVAARLQDHARPGTVIISASTYELVRACFATRPLGPLTLKGVSNAIEAFEVLGEGLSEGPPATRFCDRELPMAALEAAWAEVGDDHPKVLVLIGEPGIGKSRLAEEFRSRVEARGGGTLACTCSSFHTTTPLYPARRLVEAVCGVDTRADPARTLPQLRATLAAIGKEHLLGVFADLLGLPPAPGWEAPELEGPQLRELVLSALVEWIETATADAPALVVIDDLQWADPSTVELIGRVLRRRIPGLMLLLTAREPLPWSEGVVLDLPPLHDIDLRAMVASLPEGRELAADAVDAAVRRSEGIPLFLEELVRAADAEPINVPIGPDAAIPPTLLGPLLARLGGPGVDLGLCQAVATVGREADREILAALVGVRDDVLDTRLQVLVGARILEDVSGERRAYRFCHDLLRELAYETQLRPDRRRLHSAIADILDALDIHGIPGDAGAVGYHLELAGRTPAAVAAYTHTAQDQLAHGAFTEAVAQLDHCLALIAGIEDDHERPRLELTVRQALGIAWVSYFGYSSPQAVEEFHRCVTLCEDLGADAGPVPSIEAIWYYYILKGQLDRAHDIVVTDRRRLDLGPDALPEEGARCAIRFFRGDLRGAIDDLESFLDSPYAKRATEVPVPWPLPDDPVVNCWSFLGMARWWVCDPAGSRDAFARALERAALLPYPHGPFGTVYAKNLQVINYRVAGLDDEADPIVEEMAVIAERHGFSFFVMAANSHRMIGAARRGDPGSDIPGLVAMSQMMGTEVWTSSLAVEEGRGLLRMNDAPAAVEMADRALDAAAQNGVGFMLAEIYRLRGEARLAAGDPGGVEDFDAAVDVARLQGATLFELRSLIARSIRPGGGAARRDLATLVAEMDADGLPELTEARALLG